MPPWAIHYSDTDRAGSLFPCAELNQIGKVSADVFMILNLIHLCKGSAPQQYNRLNCVSCRCQKMTLCKAAIMEGCYLLQCYLHSLLTIMPHVCPAHHQQVSTW